MGYSLGIDLGTTYTAAAIARGDRAEIAMLGYRAMSIPTVAFLPANGTWVVGEAAERRAGQHPDRVAREFKRRVGDPAGLVLGGTPVHVERLVAEVLRWVHLQVAESEGVPPTSLVLTHPANWGEFKRDVLREAARLADLPSARLLTESVAAAGWYARAGRLKPGSTVAVYDLGGGTFDAVVLRRAGEGGFETLGVPDGIERLGGVDIDQAVLSHVLETLGDAAPDPAAEDHPATVTAMAQLRRACVEAKESLSSETSVTIPVWLPGFHNEVLLQRSELEALIRPMLEPSVKALQRAVNSAHLGADDLDAVLLVGGSSRIPLVARLISQELGRPVVVDAHPKHPVALGAALHAVGPTDAPRPQPAPRAPRQPEPAPPAPPPFGPVHSLQHAAIRAQNVPAPVENTRKRRRRSFVDLQLPALIAVLVAVAAWAVAYWDDDSPDTQTIDPPDLPPSEVWEGDLTLGSGAVLDDDHIFEVHSGTVRAINFTDPAKDWEQPTDADEAGELAVAQGVLFLSYYGAEFGYTSAYDVETGESLWTKEHMYVNKPAVVGDTLLYHVGTELIGYDLLTAEELWRDEVGVQGRVDTDGPGPIAGTEGPDPIVVDDTVVLASADGALVGFEPESREIAWQNYNALDNGITAPQPMLPAGDAVVTTWYRDDQSWRVAVFDISDGSRRWREDVVADPLVVGDALVAAGDSKLTFYGMTDGEVRANVNLEIDRGSIAVPDDVDALVYTDGAELHGVGPTGDRLWQNPASVPFQGYLVTGSHTVAVRGVDDNAATAVYEFSK